MRNKLLLLVTIISLVFTMVTPTALAADRDPFEGFPIIDFDETTATGYSTSSGYLTSSGVNKVYTFNNVDFGDYEVTGVTLGIATPPEYAGSDVKLYLDSTSSTPIATFKVQGGSWFSDSVKPDVGANRILLESHRLYNFIDLDEDFNKYKLLILPDSWQFNKKLKAKVE
ncbi:MAG: hypothetical protein IJ454_04810, partial [Clostridia bacterium]|nr:hypothetical protein [Clostridia bacterium]